MYEADEQKRKNAVYAKTYYRDRKNRVRGEGVLMQTRSSTQTQKLDERKIRETAYSKAYREHKKRLREEGVIQTQKSDEQKIREAANSKAYRERKRLREDGVLMQNYSTQESSVLQSQRRNTFETVALIHEVRNLGPNDNEQIEQRAIMDKPVSRIKQQRERQESRDYDEIVPFITQPVQKNVYIQDEMNEDVFQGEVNDNDIELREPNIFHRPEQNEVHESQEGETFAGCGQITNQTDTAMNKYTDFNKHVGARIQFNKQFIQNPFGHSCKICDRLWFKNDLKLVKDEHEDIFRQIIQNYQNGSTVAICTTCYTAIKKNNIPNLSTYNGFKYYDFPTHLPKLDIITERLISPRIPFMQIKRLRHYGHPGQYKIYGQVINVPVEVDTMVRSLPRDLDDEHSFYVHIQRKLIHKSSYLRGLVNKKNVKIWLRYLLETPLYKQYGITINESFFNNISAQSVVIDEVSENIPIEDTLTAQQQTLLWDEDKFLCIAPAENRNPISLLFDEHAEELCFPAIYLGQFRRYRITVTPFMQATSELRRSDRRGATPNHVLYLAMKIMRLRVRDCVSVAFKHVGVSTVITKEQIMQEEYINSCMESNLAFLKSIPNSTWYWANRKRDLFAMIRQLGKPTAFMTLSANEIKWIHLLTVLYKLQNNCDEVSMEEIENLNPMEKSNLVNEDPVTCAIYFNKLVNVLMTILMSKKTSPFGKYRVLHYFKRIEFQHRGSPHAHILLWLDNAPEDIFGQNYNEAIEMINSLISISASEASGNIKLNTHKHTDTCYKKIVPNKQQAKCRFEAPFMPSRKTVILLPMNKDEENYKTYRKQYADIRYNLETYTHTDIDDFYKQNNVTSDQHYYDILRAGINRPRVFLQRLPSEKWHNPFNPFVFSLLQSNMDFQIILEEYSCAQYVVEYVNKTNRGISNLQRKIIQVMDEHPEFDIVEITRKMSVDMLNTVEMSSQEAAWYLLREPLSKSSVVVIYIPTVPPDERQRIKKTMEELNKLDIESTDIWKENLIDKYEKRPENLEDLSLAQFVSKWFKNNKGEFVERKEPRIIRYRNYDITEYFNDYRREMVTLHIPFRNEQEDILQDNKYITTYEDNKDLIMSRRKEFESNLDIEKTMQICRELCRENNEDGDDDDQEVVGIVHEQNQYMRLLADPQSNVNVDLQIGSLSALGAVARRKENLMPLDEFCEQMRLANEEQKEFLIHLIHHLLVDPDTLLQIFFTSPAGCGKTWTLRLAMEIYNRFYGTDGYFNAYITCASTGKAAVAIDGQTVHTAFKITLSAFMTPLSYENLQLYRTLMKFVKVIIIDEVSMIGAELLAKLDNRLKQITGNHNVNFGGLDMIFVGDLRQLPPVRATPVYKPFGNLAQRAIGPKLWRGLKFYELKQVMRQNDAKFSSILTKIGDGTKLNQDELTLIESRFVLQETAKQQCPNGVRLFNTNASVDKYNNDVLRCIEDKVISIASDNIIGCQGVEQEGLMRQKLHKMKVIDTGGLPYEIVFVINKMYMITSNIDVNDSLSNGSIGKLVHIEPDINNEIKRVWLDFNDDKVGSKIRRKAAAEATALKLSRRAVPINRKHSNIPLNRNKTINAKRSHFPLIPAMALTIHKSQGGSFEEIVYEYENKHSLALLYVALSRVRTIEGLYITTPEDDESKFKFYHGYRNDSSSRDLIAEYKRLSLNRLQTAVLDIRDWITKRQGFSLVTLNVQSITAHALDLTDSVTRNSNMLLLSETKRKNDETINVPNFKCVSQFQRQNYRHGGVAILQNVEDIRNVIITNMSLMINTDLLELGDICSCHIQLQDGKSVVVIAIYISPGNNIKDTIAFIDRSLSRLADTNLRTMPVILGGDFNCNFLDNQSQPLVNFLFEKFQLSINSDVNYSTTRYGTTIDAVFARFIDTIECKTFVSYFSYHKPIITSLK